MNLEGNQSRPTRSGVQSNPTTLGQDTTSPTKHNRNNRSFTPRSAGDGIDKEEGETTLVRSSPSKKPMGSLSKVGDGADQDDESGIDNNRLILARVSDWSSDKES